jgi:hypothetical protein
VAVGVASRSVGRAVAAAVVGEAVGASADTRVGVEAPLDDGDAGVAQPVATTASAAARKSTLYERRD